jgi:hypothetical protein
MVRPFRISSAALLCFGLAVPRLHAQSLAAGTWTGTMTPPTSGTVTVTYAVAGTGDSITISMKAPDGRQLPFNHIRFESGKLLFDWSPGGTTVTCALESQPDGGYRGPCTDLEGKTGHLAMVPPKP